MNPGDVIYLDSASDGAEAVVIWANDAEVRVRWVDDGEYETMDRVERDVLEDSAGEEWVVI